MTGIIIQQIFNALTIGAIYAMIALGYTMVYGVLRLINFVHGDLFMLGAYVALAGFVLLAPGGGLVWALAAALIAIAVFMVVGGVGVAIERTAYKPLRNSNRLAPMLSSLGLSLALQTAVQITMGPQPIAFQSLFPAIPLDFLGARITTVQIGIVVAALLLMVGLKLFIARSRLGVVVRAVSENRRTAQLLGVDVDKAISTIFFIGPGLGALGGVLFASYYGVMMPTMGIIIGLKAFTAAILGGIGSITGAVVGGFLLAFFEVFGTAMLPILTNGWLGTEYRDIFAFLMLILVLLFRPAGLFGEQTSEESMVMKRDF
ncbi:branched-chain amino acid ABC transporter permease [Methylobrevis pamukkalensis]|uniref:High-affinity branched-chain amino acid transport system permease protein LivH n=1 Tax=Methylobrevis pamukkalensis TaxID=1439726 RepID=A0A1E3H4I3_9HYPH|nr:branched-chain amino acid ABC transporter permease [Methylobrevis pamukkalensis]ODN71238.1 High-affinity branched-chain amino acid transport system permease protein LivH [Methylobrevis pamukkalensis]